MADPTGLVGHVIASQLRWLLIDALPDRTQFIKSLSDLQILALCEGCYEFAG